MKRAREGIQSLRVTARLLARVTKRENLDLFSRMQTSRAVSQGKEPKFKMACFMERLPQIRAVGLPAKGGSIGSS